MQAVISTHSKYVITSSPGVINIIACRHRACIRQALTGPYIVALMGHIGMWPLGH